MAKPQQQPLPKPTAPPSPVQATPKGEAPVITSVALGRTAEGKHAVAMLRTQGMALLSCELLAQPTRDAAVAEDVWRVCAYPVLFHGEKVPTFAGTLVTGTGLALVKTPANTYAVTVVEMDGGKVQPPRKADPHALTDEERKGSTLYEGKKLDAWHELDSHAAKYLLRESLAERRRKAAGR